MSRYMIVSHVGFMIVLQSLLTLSSLYKKIHKAHPLPIFIAATPWGHCDLYTHSKAHGLGLYLPHYTQERLSLDYRVPICCLEATQISSGFVAYHGTTRCRCWFTQGIYKYLLDKLLDNCWLVFLKQQKKDWYEEVGWVSRDLWAPKIDFINTLIS
jgi:hypothetical protein